MKINFKQSIFIVWEAIEKLWSKHKKKKQIRVLLYTDSRGDNLPNDRTYKHYSTRLSDSYIVEKYLCPRKWTTIIDFISLYEKRKIKKNYDLIILHAGIVDWSPRHQKIARKNIYGGKKKLFNSIFTKNEMIHHLSLNFHNTYEGDKTINMYSLDMAKRHLLPVLKKIPNLLWISTNRIVADWDGNYWKKRPKNMNITINYSKIFMKELNSINLLVWDNDSVKRFTHDNVHPNKQGSDYIYNKLVEKINNLFPKE